MHWVCAVIFMQAKRIQFYDSMGGDGRRYLNALFQYVKDEHQDKKKCPLPDEDEWEFIECTSDTPRQRNGTEFLRVRMYATVTTVSTHLILLLTRFRLRSVHVHVC
jgi:hypothetical protein